MTETEAGKVAAQPLTCPWCRLTRGWDLKLKVCRIDTPRIFSTQPEQLVIEEFPVLQWKCVLCGYRELSERIEVGT